MLVFLLVVVTVTGAFLFVIVCGYLLFLFIICGYLLLFVVICYFCLLLFVVIFLFVRSCLRFFVSFDWVTVTSGAHALSFTCPSPSRNRNLI